VKATTPAPPEPVGESVGSRRTPGGGVILLAAVGLFVGGSLLGSILLTVASLIVDPRARTGPHPGVAGGTAPWGPTSPLFLLLAVWCTTTVTALLVVAVAMRAPEGWSDRLGLVRGRLPVRHYPLLVLSSISAIVIGMVLVNGLQQVHVLPPFGVYRESLGRMLGQGTPAFRVAFILGASLLTGIEEELLFRGYLLRGLLRCWRAPTAVLVTSAFFSFAHGDIAYIVFTMPVSLWLGYLAWRGGSVVPGMVCHVATNGTFQTAGAFFSARLQHAADSAGALVGPWLPPVAVQGATLAVSVAMLLLGVRCVEYRRAVAGRDAQGPVLPRR
jgi:uncharacterized protein